MIVAMFCCHVLSLCAWIHAGLPPDAAKRVVMAAWMLHVCFRGEAGARFFSGKVDARRWRAARAGGGCGGGRFGRESVAPPCSAKGACSCVRSFRVFWNLRLQVAMYCLIVAMFCCHVRRYIRFVTSCCETHCNRCMNNVALGVLGRKGRLIASASSAPAAPSASSRFQRLHRPHRPHAAPAAPSAPSAPSASSAGAPSAPSAPSVYCFAFWKAQ